MFLNQMPVQITTLPRHQNGTVQVEKPIVEAIVFTNTPGPIISDERYLMVDKAWRPAFEALDCQRALAGALVGAPSVCSVSNGSG
jgi:hypothetical protein